MVAWVKVELINRRLAQASTAIFSYLSVGYLMLRFLIARQINGVKTMIANNR
jgi:hypothetical protein